VVAVLAAGLWLRRGSARNDAARTDAPAAARAGDQRPLPVVGAAARQGDVPVYLTGLGTVTAFNTVTVKSRVDGQLIRIAFEEGQIVKEGDVLAEVDPRPFQVQLTQAEGQLARDEAQLKDANAALARFRDLVAHGIVSKQDYDDRVATAGQFEGAILADHGQIDSAKLQLTYSRITAPIGGRVGLRLVDVGNVVHATDAGGLVVITQTTPIAILFTIPEDDLPAVLKKLRTGEPLPVDAYDRAGATQLATGSLLATDNQIDRTTGTMRLKAMFANDDGMLFPNQFVNVNLLVDIRKEAVIVPTAAIQHGPQGAFVYAVKPDHTVEVRPVAVGPEAGHDVAVERGVAPGDVVVVDGVDKLRGGSPVEVTMAPAQAAASGAAKPSEAQDTRRPAPGAPPG